MWGTLETRSLWALSEVRQPVSSPHHCPTGAYTLPVWAREGPFVFLNPGHPVERPLHSSQGIKLSTAGPVYWAAHGSLLVMMLRFLFHPFTHCLFLLPISSPEVSKYAQNSSPLCLVPNKTHSLPEPQNWMFFKIWTLEGGSSQAEDISHQVILMVVWVRQKLLCPQQSLSQITWMVVKQADPWVASQTQWHRLSSRLHILT